MKLYTISFMLLLSILLSSFQNFSKCIIKQSLIDLTINSKTDKPIAFNIYLISYQNNKK